MTITKKNTSSLKEAVITQPQLPNAVGDVGEVLSLLLGKERPKSRCLNKYPHFLILPINAIFL